MTRTLGLIGGVASGKSFVADCFRELGAPVLDGDRIGHSVLEKPDVIALLQARWGAGICDAQGAVRRAEVADRVFADGERGRAELAFLEAITHPRIEAELAAGIATAQSHGQGVVVLDAAVLLKAGWDRLCDHLLLVDVPRGMRLARALGRGMTEVQFDAREARQLPLAEKRERADFVIDNGGSRKNTRRQVEEVWHSLQQIA